MFQSKNICLKDGSLTRRFKTSHNVLTQLINNFIESEQDRQYMMKIIAASRWLEDAEGSRSAPVH